MLTPRAVLAKFCRSRWGEAPMTLARSHLVDVSVTRWYHCVTRCVRRALLLGEAPWNRKQWIERRLQELAEIFAVAVGGFSVLDNHLHLLVRLDPEVAKTWSDEDVVRRWGKLFAPRDKSRQPLPVSKDWVEMKLKDARWLAAARERLQSLSWFMKCLKELHFARLANSQDQTAKRLSSKSDSRASRSSMRNHCWPPAPTSISIRWPPALSRSRKKALTHRLRSESNRSRLRAEPAT